MIQRIPRPLRLGVLLGAVLALASAHLATGSTASAAETWAAVFGHSDRLTAQIVHDLRMPRMLVGAGAGMCLGMAGVVLQAVLRNPLASPDVTGVGSGAVLGAVAATLIGGDLASPDRMILVAVVGGTLGGAVLWLVAMRAGTDPVRLVVIGVMVSAAFSGGSMVLLTARPQLTGSMTQWLIGSLNGRTWAHWSALWPWLLTAAVAGLLVSAVIQLLSVDDDHGHAVGLAVSPWRSAVLLVAVVLTAVAIASVGAMAFVGLLAPHAARALFGADLRFALPAAGMLGAAAVCGADVVAQTVTSWAADPSHAGVPTGAVTAVLGAVVLIRVARRTSTTGGN
ncbi:iron complex transport system permease protein [Saccharopolyspora kobensis]|uniref:Iron complex transport system permease protein n=1 Tax=Saccharopolyspora kobensis TaxID=146035 RepID=A0A1H6A1P6_9PSEU|nr:iron ABC transporter permease [Saccharopolyspora kobensis]SEG42330.1 iron complex transport system permease protein [Saccharopolyspora kobensis]SFE17737.1 iron complex transport system permease protein [Saccharopolyspora kobensis]